MRYLFSKDPIDGSVQYNGPLEDNAPVPSGTWAATETDMNGMMPVQWMEDKVWDDALGRPRVLTQAEIIARAKEAKRAELEAAFADENRKNFPVRGDEPADGGIWRFLGVYTTNQNDSRIVAFKAHKQRLDDRITRLDNLGKGGNNPPLTLEEIAKIVW